MELRARNTSVSYTADTVILTEEGGGDGGAKHRTKKAASLSKSGPLSVLADEGPILDAPIKTLPYGRDIEKFYAEVIREQVQSINFVSCQLACAFRDKRSYRGAGRPAIFSFCISGSSGSGKTEFWLRTRQLLGLEPGYEYEGLCVELDGSLLGDAQQVNCMTGAAAGLVGYKDGGSLADLLKNALDSYNNKSRRNILRLHAAGKKEEMIREAEAYTKRQANPATAEPEQAPFVVLFIDELDKVSYEFLLNINGLLDKGEYYTPSGVRFKLPQDTLFFVFTTANYGGDAIAAMPDTWEDTAKAHIEADMRAQGLQPYTIQRLGYLVPFYPLKPHVLRDLLASKLADYIARSTIANKYGSGMIQYDDEVKDVLIEHVLRRLRDENGVREGLKGLFSKLNALFDLAFGALDRMLGIGDERAPLSEPLRITAHNIDTNKFGEAVDQELNDIMMHIRENSANADAMMAVKKYDGQSQLTAMGMSYRGSLLGQMVLHCSVQQHTSIHVHSEAKTARIIEQLKGKQQRLEHRQRDLKQDYREFIGQIAAVEPNERVVELLKRKEDSLATSDESTGDSVDDLDTEGECDGDDNDGGIDEEPPLLLQAAPVSDQQQTTTKKRKPDLFGSLLSGVNRTNSSSSSNNNNNDTSDIDNRTKKKIRVTHSADGETHSLSVHEQRTVEYHTSAQELAESGFLDDLLGGAASASFQSIRPPMTRRSPRTRRSPVVEEMEVEADSSVSDNNNNGDSDEQTPGNVAEDGDAGDADEDEQPGQRARGRPKRLIPGFSWHSKEASRHSIYQCNRCKTKVDIRYTKNHTCPV